MPTAFNEMKNLNAVAHFARWMSMCSLPARMLDEGCIDQFLRYHLPRCDCLGGALRTPNEAHAALVPMLEIWRAEGVIARPPAPAGAIADELRSYDGHMHDARGLASKTRSGRLRIVERLLAAKHAGRPVVVGELRAEDIRQFIADQLDALGTTRNAMTIASTLRAYLRYRATRRDAVQPLLAVIASPAHWSMASLPRGLKPVADVLRRRSLNTDAWRPLWPELIRSMVRLGLVSAIYALAQRDDDDSRGTAASAAVRTKSRTSSLTSGTTRTSAPWWMPRSRRVRRASRSSFSGRCSRCWTSGSSMLRKRRCTGLTRSGPRASFFRHRHQNSDRTGEATRRNTRME
jgi:hypothetical protein